jgi:hypothetical protein
VKNVMQIACNLYHEPSQPMRRLLRLAKSLFRAHRASPLSATYFSSASPRYAHIRAAMKQELSKISVFRFEAFRNIDAESNIELVRDSLQVVEAHSLKPGLTGLTGRWMVGGYIDGQTN